MKRKTIKNRRYERLRIVNVHLTRGRKSGTFAEDGKKFSKDTVADVLE